MIRRRGLSSDEILRYRRFARRKLEASLGSRNDHVLISAEGLLKVDGSGRADLAVFLRRFFPQIRVVAYIRPPVSYLSSAFQQKVKGSTIKTFDPDGGWARYRARLEDWDRHFGRENVSFWKYAPERFPGGCVVRDFAGRLGLDIPADKIVRSNSSLSRAGLGILYAYRKHGPESGVGLAVSAANTALVRAAQSVGGPKFRLAGSVTRRVCERHADDLSWIENRLGESLAEKAGDHEHDVAEEADLFQLTSDDCEAFVAAFEKRTGFAVRVRFPATLDPRPEAVARLVEACRQVYLQRPSTRLRAAAWQVAFKLLR
ncbi:MAG: hypothetical protein AB7F99_07075 [Vicinamibacterales bacterium]